MNIKPLYTFPELCALLGLSRYRTRKRLGNILVDVVESAIPLSIIKDREPEIYRSILLANGREEKPVGQVKRCKYRHKVDD